MANTNWSLTIEKSKLNIKSIEIKKKQVVKSQKKVHTLSKKWNT